MSRPYSPKIVTANDLRIGDVVYLTADDHWSRAHHEAVGAQHRLARSGSEER